MRAFGVIYLFVIMFTVFVQKVKILKVILGKFYMFFIQVSWVSQNAKMTAMLADPITLHHKSARC